MIPVNGKRLDRPETDLSDPTAPKQQKMEFGQIDPWIDENYDNLETELAHCRDWTYLKSAFGSAALNKWGPQIVYTLFAGAPHLCKGLNFWENNVTLFQKVKARWTERIRKEFESRETLKGVLSENEIDDIFYTNPTLHSLVSERSGDFSFSNTAIFRISSGCNRIGLDDDDLGDVDSNSVYTNKFPVLKLIPCEMLDLSYLKELVIVNKQLEEIPKGISRLTNLSKLVLSKNQIREVPDELAALPYLTILHLMENPIEKISEKVRELHLKGKLDLAVPVNVSVKPITIVTQNRIWPWCSADLFFLIFRLVPAIELIRNVSMVCKDWYEQTSSDEFWGRFSYKTLFPNSIVFDQQAWEALVPSIENYNFAFERSIPRLTKRDYIVLKQMESRMEDPENQSLGFVTIPQNLTLAHLIKIAGDDFFDDATILGKEFDGYLNDDEVRQLRGNSKKIEDYIESRARYGISNIGTEEFWNATKEKREWKYPATRTIATTQGILKNSEVQEHEAQIAFVKGLGCQVPELIPMLAFRILINAHHKKNPTNVLIFDRSTTCCTHIDTNYRYPFSSSGQIRDVIGVVDLDELYNQPFDEDPFFGPHAGIAAQYNID